MTGDLEVDYYPCTWQFRGDVNGSRRAVFFPHAYHFNNTVLITNIVGQVLSSQVKEARMSAKAASASFITDRSCDNQLRQSICCINTNKENYIEWTQSS